MSLKNFMSYGDAETVLTGFANEIKSKDTAYTTITYSDWLAMSDAQKEAGKYYITGVPGADGTIQIDLMTKLWENSDPASAMASGTTFTLSSSDYDHLLIIAKIKNDSTLCSAIMSPKDNGIALTIATEGKVASRNVLFSSATSGTFYSGYFNGAVDNDYAIPITIYGIKFHHEIEVSAIGLGCVKMSKLWENPDPTANFAAGNITLSSDDYDLLLVIYNWSTTSNDNLSNVSVKGNKIAINLATNNSSNVARNYERYGTPTDATHISFTDCTYTGGVTDNRNAIPYRIYGIKLT
jgi:hypothetical protein